jgi:hypothetical protein
VFSGQSSHPQSSQTPILTYHVHQTHPEEYKANIIVVFFSLDRERDKTTILYCSTFYVHFDGSRPKLKSLPPTLYMVSDKYEILQGLISMVTQTSDAKISIG